MHTFLHCERGYDLKLKFNFEGNDIFLGFRFMYINQKTRYQEDKRFKSVILYNYNILDEW